MKTPTGAEGGPVVAHVVRKRSQLDQSFIFNQLSFHLRYRPVLVSSQADDVGGLARELLNAHPSVVASRRLGFGKRQASSAALRRLAALIGFDAHGATRFLHQQGARVCHFHYGSDAVSLLRCAHKSGLPSVVSFYGYDCSSFPKWYLGLGRLGLKIVFHGATRILAMSKAMLRDLVELGCPRDKLVAHYQGCDVRELAHPRTYTDSRPLKLLILANLAPQKGHETLIGAMGEVMRTQQNIHLRVVGGPAASYPDRPRALQEMVRRNGLTSVVTFVGAVPYLSAEFRREFANADVFVHPSVVSPRGEKEGIPGALVEAMAAGLPVISTYHAGIPEVVADGVTGLLVPEQDVGALAGAIARVAEDRALRARLGRAAQAFALATLDVRDKEIELEQIYDDAIDASRADTGM
jgi:colanic acid/amylovoran biosynthesis glycosyltransferase